MVTSNDKPELSLINDFRLLVALDALLQTESVTKAAKRLRLSPSAMSRALRRIQQRLGDPILARAGRGMVATPRGTELRERVHQLVQEAEVLLSSGEPDASTGAWRNFALIIEDGYAGVLAPHLLSDDHPQASRATFCFLPEGQAGDTALREGTAALAIGRVHSPSPELRVENLLLSRYVGLARAGHELVHCPPDMEVFADASHIEILEAESVTEAVDATLAKYELRRRVAVATRDYTSAFSMISHTDLVAVVPEIMIHPGLLAAGIRPFELPLLVSSVTVRMAWHPRSEADPLHAWLRARVRDTLRNAPASIASD
ncbi:LysR family transcriptional regulator [Actinomadura chokoriensis]|uniref:LysR family transcriptional regulator n=1 Tax=Actinomadura chokoriensis TaxID=454156 RepID=A0ABV4R2J1_9ACTN